MGTTLRAVAAFFALAALSSCRSSRSSQETLPPVAATGAHSLRVMTYNIAAGTGGGAGGDTTGLVQIARVIRAANPDIVALQEVDVHWSQRSGFADQATALARSLGMEARFAPIYHVGSSEPGAPPREYGVALLSRFPVTAFRNHPITRLSTQQPPTPPAPAPGLLEATVAVHGAAVRVFNTHLDYRADPAVRVTQVREMLAIIGNASAPTLLFGDMNATPDAAELQPLFGVLADAWKGAGTGAGESYPAKAPTKRIDYVLVSRHFRAAAAHVVSTEASDHRPVVADLELAAHLR